MKHVVIALCFLGLAIYVFGFAADTHALPAGYDSYSMWFLVIVNGQETGMISINVKEGSFQSIYYGISEVYNLPFFSRIKSGNFRDRVYSTSLVFDGEAFNIYNDLDKAPEQVRDEVRSSWKKKAVIVDKENLPRLIFDQIPVVVLENLIISFVHGDAQRNLEQRYLLFDDQMPASIYIAQDNSRPVPTDIRSTITEYVCKRTNVPGQPDVSLFRAFLTEEGVPVGIEALSGRWKLRLYSLGKKETKERIYPKKWFLNQAKYSLAGPAKGLSLNFGEATLNKRQIAIKYTVETPAKKYNPEWLAAAYFKRRYSRSAGSVMVTEKDAKAFASFSYGGSFEISANQDEIFDELADRYEKRGKRLSKDDSNFEIIEGILSINFRSFLSAAKSSGIKCKEPGAYLVWDEKSFIGIDRGQKLACVKGDDVVSELSNKDMLFVAAHYLRTSPNTKRYHGSELSVEEVSIDQDFVKMKFTGKRKITEKEKRNVATDIIKDKLFGDTGLADINALSKDIKLITGGSYILTVAEKKLDAVGQDLAESNCCKRGPTFSGFSECDVGKDHVCRITGEYIMTRSQLEIRLKKELKAKHSHLNYMGDEAICMTGDDWYFTNLVGPINEYGQ